MLRIYDGIIIFKNNNLLLMYKNTRYPTYKNDNVIIFHKFIHISFLKVDKC